MEGGGGSPGILPLLWCIECPCPQGVDGCTGVLVHPGDALIVGRQEADISIIDRSVSRKHATIKLALAPNSQSVLTVTDMSSKFGVFVNEIRIQAEAPHQLADGDRVRFGALPSIYTYTQLMAKPYVHHPAPWKRRHTEGPNSIRARIKSFPFLPFLSELRDAERWDSIQRQMTAKDIMVSDDPSLFTHLVIDRLAPTSALCDAVCCGKTVISVETLASLVEGSHRIAQSKEALDALECTPSAVLSQLELVIASNLLKEQRNATIIERLVTQSGGKIVSEPSEGRRGNALRIVASATSAASQETIKELELSSLFAAIRSGSCIPIEGFSLPAEQEAAHALKAAEAQQKPLMKWAVSEEMLRKRPPGHTSLMARPESQEETAAQPSSVATTAAPIARVRGNFKRFKKAQTRSGSWNIISVDRMKAFTVDPTTTTERSSPFDTSDTRANSQMRTEGGTRAADESWLSLAPLITRPAIVRPDENLQPNNEAPLALPPASDKPGAGKPVQSAPAFKSNLFNSIKK